MSQGNRHKPSTPSNRAGCERGTLFRVLDVGRQRQESGRWKRRVCAAKGPRKCPAQGSGQWGLTPPLPAGNWGGGPGPLRTGPGPSIFKTVEAGPRELPGEGALHPSAGAPTPSALLERPALDLASETPEPQGAAFPAPQGVSLAEEGPGFCESSVTGTRGQTPHSPALTQPATV